LRQALDAPLVHPQRGCNQQYGKNKCKQNAAVQVPGSCGQQDRMIHSDKPNAPKEGSQVLWATKRGTIGGQKRDNEQERLWAKVLAAASDLK